MPRSSSDILVSGSSSGLGKYLRENLRAYGLDRDNAPAELRRLRRRGADTVIHCAFNRSREVTSETLSAYLQDNLFLTQQLLQVPHRKFVYISSVDVYPHARRIHREDEVIDIEQVCGMYARLKLMSEALVRSAGGNFLILRPVAMLGEYARENSLIKIIKGTSPTLTLSRDSRFNYILYSDLLAFLRKALEQDARGIYNLASATSVRLGDIVRLFRRRIEFGSFCYDSGRVATEKCLSIHKGFKKTSLAVIKEFARSIHV